MGKTHRKTSLTDWKTRVGYINREVSRWHIRPYRMKKIRKTKEEYEADCLAASNRYRLGETRYLTHVSKFRYIVEPVTVEEIIEQADREYAGWSRDGKLNETGRNKEFKRLARQAVRRRWKELKHRIMRGEEPDEPYPNESMGKSLAWAVW